jgi:hypothetical protein
MFSDNEYPEDVLSAAMWFAEGKSGVRHHRRLKKKGRTR